MKNLDHYQRGLLHQKRKRYSLSLNELAIILNCTEEQMADAQVGSQLHEEVHYAVINWLEEEPA